MRKTLKVVAFGGRPVVPSYDTDAQAFITAANITGSTQKTAINTLVTDLKFYNLWTKMKAVYPFVTDKYNLLSYTEDFSNAVWGKGTSTVTTNATAAPNGTITADAIIPTAGTDVQHNIYQSLSIQNGESYTFSASLKAFGYTYGMLSFYDGTFKYVIFDLVNGVVTNSASGTTYTILSQGNGWYRCSVTITSSSTIAGYNYIGPVPTSNFVQPTVWNANGTSGIYGWGAQTQVGTLTTYQPVLGANNYSTDVAAQMKFNLVNPQDSDAAFRLAFSGGWIYSTNGAKPNGTNAYANTNFNPFSNSSLNSKHYSYYSRTTSNNIEVEIGNKDSIYNSFVEIRTSGVTYCQLNTGAGTNINFTDSDSKGFYIANRTASNIINGWKNSTKQVTGSTTALNLPNSNIYLGAFNNNGSALYYSTKECAFATIGDGLTDTDASNLYTIIQNYQTILNRQV